MFCQSYALENNLLLSHLARRSTYVKDIRIVAGNINWKNDLTGETKAFLSLICQRLQRHVFDLNASFRMKLELISAKIGFELVSQICVHLFISFLGG